MRPAPGLWAAGAHLSLLPSAPDMVLGVLGQVHSPEPPVQPPRGTSSAQPRGLPKVDVQCGVLS